MCEERGGDGEGRGTVATGDKEMAPKSVPLAAAGIETGGDFAKFMSALMSDLIEGRVTPSVGNAAVNAGGKLLKVVEMQLKYGTTGGNSRKQLQLVD